METKQTIQLPDPDMTGGKPLMEAMKERHSSRDFSNSDLTLEEISNLLWAAYGINRPDGKRTVPSACAAYPLTVIVVTGKGIYTYSPEENTLTLVKEGDYRKEAGNQPYVEKAFLNLVYFADFSKYHTGNEMLDRLMADEVVRNRFALLDTGHCSQNVYLYGASAGLKVVTRGMANEKFFKEVLGMSDECHFMLAQSVGK